MWAQEWFRQVTEFCWIRKQKVPFVCFMSNKVKSQWWKLLLVPLKVWELFLLLQSCRALDFTLKHPMLRRIWSNRRFSRNRQLTLFRSSSNLALVSSSNALMSAMVIPCHLSVQQNSCSYIVIALIGQVKLCFFTSLWKLVNILFSVPWMKLSTLFCSPHLKQPDENKQYEDNFSIVFAT